jgi:hypothetical protein
VLNRSRADVLFACIYIGLTLAVCETVRRTWDHPAAVRFDWAMLYVWAVIVPAVWGVRTRRALHRWKVPPTPDAQVLPWAPAIVGALLLANTLMLLSRAHERHGP